MEWFFYGEISTSARHLNNSVVGDDIVWACKKLQEVRIKNLTITISVAGWDTKDMLGGIDGVMQLAAASGEDLGAVSDIVTDSLTAFGMKAKDSGRFADVLAQTSSKANTDVRGLGEAFKYAAPVAGALGYTVEDTSIAIGLMSNAGMDMLEHTVMCA